MRVKWIGLRLATAVAVVVAVGAPMAWSQTEYLVAPRDTDTAIDQWLKPHVVEIDRSAATRNFLYVHIPGSYGLPSDSKLILKQAARHGYPAIGLRYPNSWTVYTLCTASSDPACFKNVRLEILDGIDRTGLVAISEANSITNRLAKLLEYLDGAHPEDDWGRFLNDDGDIIWSKIVVSGHSQGAGHAAMIAHVHKVSRVGMFAGPPDFSSFFEAPADWLSETGETPVGSYFGFGHMRDSLVPEHNLVEIWEALGLGLFGAPVNIDEPTPHIGRSHMFFTAADPAVFGLIADHNSVVVDRQTPKRADGSPGFDFVWDEMCFLDGSSEIPGVQIRRPGRRVRPR